jgi:hypothetical protein
VRKQAHKKLKKSGAQNMHTAGGRLRAAMVAAAMDAKKVAKELGVSPQIVRTWMRQPTRYAHMSAEYLAKLSNLLLCRGVWLAAGDGPPTRYIANEVSREKLLSLFDSLSAERKRLLVHIAMHLSRE